MVGEKKVLVLFSTLIAISSLTLVSRVVDEKVKVQGQDSTYELYLVNAVTFDNNFNKPLAANKSTDNSTFYQWSAGFQKVAPATRAGDWAWLDVRVELAHGTANWDTDEWGNRYFLDYKGGSGTAGQLNFAIEVDAFGFHALQFNNVYSNSTPSSGTSHVLKVYSGPNCTGTCHTINGNGQVGSFWAPWTWKAPIIDIGRSFRLELYGFTTYKFGALTLQLYEC